MHNQDKFASALKALWPLADSHVPGLTQGIIDAAPTVLPKYDCDSDLVLCHAMAQFSEECGCGAEMQENMNYSAARLLKIFPAHFTHAQAIAMQHQPRLIADQAYGGRMGNAPPPSEDGWNFRGQGLSQVTGKGDYGPNKPKEGYAALAEETGLDLMNHPELIIAPATTFECGIGDFVLCGCLNYAKSDSLIGVSAMLNVGHYVGDPSKINGYSMRRNWLGLWKHAMGIV